MKACKHLSGSKERILKHWEDASLAKLPDAHNLTRQAMRDHIPQVFSALCEVLETKEFLAPKELSKTHGRLRSWTTDYSLGEVMGEYALLKNVIYDDLVRAEIIDVTEWRLIDRFFDSAQTIATVEFVKMREHELNAMTDSLVTMNQDLETFAAVAAHDLRSPTSTILGYADLIALEKGAASDVADKAVAVIKRTAVRMLELIDQLLDYSKIGKEHLARKSFSLKATANEAVTNLTSQVESIKAKVIIDDLPEYTGDAILFRQLFQNLISNSLKFCAEGRVCEVKVSAHFVQNKLQVKVTDNGMGFDPQLAETIFQPFKRGGQKGVQGSGLGLATARKIVELHNGKISAIGKIDQGSEILIELPVSPD